MNFKISKGEEMRWPKKCVTCGGNATTSNMAYGSSLAGYKFKLILHEFTHNTVDISYPICIKHKYTVMIIRALYYISGFAMLVFGLLTFVFLVLLIANVPDSYLFNHQEGLKFCFIFLISIIAFIVLWKLQPIRLKNIGEYFITIVIRNEQYAQEFALLNGLDPL